MFAIRLTTLTAILVLAACGTAGSTSAGQAGGLVRVAETRPVGWDMLDASLDPNTTAGAFVAPRSNSCDDAGNCVSRD